MYRYPIFPKYEGLPLLPTTHAQHELDCLGLDLYDVVAILEHGFDTSPGRRKAEIRERGIRKGNKLIKAVVEKEENHHDFWRLKHVGETTYKKGRYEDHRLG